MAYPPNQSVPNFTVFNGGTAGARVTPGQYYYDWLVSLGGSIELSNNDTTFNVVMPFHNGVPDAIPDDLGASLLIWKESVIAAVRGIAYPPLPSAGQYCYGPYYP